MKADLALTWPGIKQSDIPELAAQAIQDPCVITNPVQTSPKGVEELYEHAL